MGYWIFMKKIIASFLASFLILLILVAPVQVLAQNTDSKPKSATKSTDLELSAEASDSTIQNIKAILKKKADQIQGEISDLSYQKRGFIGEITRVTEETLTIKNKKGTQIIPLTDDLKLIKKNEEIITEDIAVGDWVTIMGLVENDTFAPKKIYISSTSLQPNDHFIMLGTVEEISSKSLTFKSRSQEVTQDLIINTKTDFQDNQGEDAFLKDFDENMQALLIGYEDEDGKIVTKLRALAPFDKEQ